MKKPVLDPRTINGVVEKMRERAKSYTPEWHFDGDLSDPGTALSQVFGEMYVHTLDRFNGLPQKFYTEFMNMLGVTEPDAMPAAGYVRFDVHDAAEHAVAVPEHTLLGAPNEDAGENVIFETSVRIEATPARLESVFYSDTSRDLLQKLDLSRGGETLFGENESENLSGHVLTLSQNEALAAQGSCYIAVELHQQVQFRDRQMLEMLSDSAQALWSWFDGEKWVPFSEAAVTGDKLLLHKQDRVPIAADEDGRLKIRCELRKPEGETLIEEALLSSVPEDESMISEMAFGDLPLEGGRGYCFGRRPSIYDLFYLRSDDVFCKRGTEVSLKLTVSTEAEDPNQGMMEYDWSQSVISKEDSAPVVPDDVVIRRVIWEYYNGEGWAPLHTKGDNNPFLPVNKGTICVLRFEIPMDIDSVIVNAQEGFYVRARIAEMENAMSLKPRWMLPYITEASCTWQYLKGVHCDFIEAVNDGETVTLEDASDMAKLHLRAFYPTKSPGRSLYFRFDRSPDALPLTMLFQLRHNGVLPSKVNFEALSHGRFVPIRTTDMTRNFRLTGVVSLYLPDVLTTERLFGEEGCWLRATCEGSQYLEDLLPKLERVDVNVAPAVQRQQSEEQYFSTEPYAKNKRITLLSTPVQDAEVWIDETGHLSGAELRELREKPGALLEETADDGSTTCRVRWQRTRDIRLAAGTDRVYELDTASGEIRFGDDRHGRIPPEGGDNICVTYAYGGGTVGNLPVSTITSLIGAIPMVDQIENVTATCGGTESGDREWLDSVGTLRLRHRDRALGVQDFEDMVLEHFPRVCRVKCFAGKNQYGAYAPGHVTVVFLCTEATNLADTSDMAQQIFRYLSEHCECTMITASRLHVLPATEISVFVEAQVELRDLNRAADTQQHLTGEITNLIDHVWRQRGIGQELRISELYQLLAETPNVALVKQVLVRGVWIENGIERACNLEEEQNIPYTAVRSGEHAIRVM